MYQLHVGLASGRTAFSSCGADPSKAKKKKKRLSSPAVTSRNMQPRAARSTGGWRLAAVSRQPVRNQEQEQEPREPGAASTGYGRPRAGQGAKAARAFVLFADASAGGQPVSGHPVIFLYNATTCPASVFVGR
jgi:hypothetical protein